MIPVFDGHNDLLLRLLRNPGARDAIWGGADGSGHLDLPRMRAGGFAGGLFAIYVPSPEGPGDAMAALDTPPYDMPLPPTVPLAAAQADALAMTGHLLALERAGGLRLCRSVAEIDAAMATGIVAAVMHMEGAEAIDGRLDALHAFHAMGLRSLGPVWSRPTIFGHGVPFRFPGTPDTGPGLTDAGKRLVRECNALRILIDLSHLNAKGFDDVAAISDAPLVASHSNAHAVTPSTRNLTDRQMDAIRDSDGLVGLNFATAFLRPDGRQDAGTGWDAILRHLDHMIDRMGEDHVALGSDFDGAVIPDVIADAAGLQRLLQALSDHGYDAPLIARIAHGNWRRVLGLTIG